MLDLLPDPGGGPGEGWAERRLAELSAALAVALDAARPALATHLAKLLLAMARDAEADAVLLEASRRAALVRDTRGLVLLELAQAWVAAVRDDGSGADAGLSAARALLPELPPSLAARAWLVGARRGRSRGEVASERPPEDPPVSADDPMAVDERSELAAELALAHAAWARETLSVDAARDALNRAHPIAARSPSITHAAEIDLEAAALSAAIGDVERARHACESALQRLATTGLRRDLGRAMLRRAELVAPGGERAGDTAASWFGRAEATLGSDASWRDRLLIRAGLRAVGRRGVDRVMSETTWSGVEAFERARGAVLSELSRAGYEAGKTLTEVECSLREEAPPDPWPTLARVGAARAASRAHTERATTAVVELDRSMRGLVDLVGAALFERERLRALLEVLAQLDQAADEARLSSVIAALALPLLDADRVVVALRRGETLTVLVDAGAPLQGTEDTWRALLDETGQRPSKRPARDLAPRDAQSLAGDHLAVPVHGEATTGLLYADRLRRHGQFREQDEAIAHLLGEYLALAFGRLEARAEERFALQKLSVTLDTLRDAVVALDAAGVVVSLNAAALRMLHLSSDTPPGFRLESVPALAPLGALLSTRPRVDGAVVRLPFASFVVTARSIAGPGDEDRGLVATLVELDRAQKIAQRLTATRARYGFHDIVGTSVAMTDALAVARRAAGFDATVLIHGESGTGKEVIAQAIHTAGPRVHEPFVGINCAAVPRELLEAELFGYEKGAFTGARADGNVGKFELAAGGTILLDEIGDMPLDMQAKLLRVLQERVVTRLGGRHEVSVHARVIATTHRDLEQLVHEGKFRMDLLYRLRVLALELPPLRERPEDIPLLARHYLARFAEQQRRRLRELAPRVQDELARYDWPGNVRELANVMEAEVSLAPPDADVLERLATRLVGRFRTTSATSTGEWARLPSVLPSDGPIVPLAEVEKRSILSAIERCGGSVSKAADALGVSKVTLYAKLRAWGMHPRDRAEDGNDGPSSARASSPRLPRFDDPPPTSPTLPPKRWPST